MDSMLEHLLLKEVPPRFETAETWFDNSWTQGNGHPLPVIKRMKEPISTNLDCILNNSYNNKNVIDPAKQYIQSRNTRDIQARENKTRENKKQKDLSFVDFLAEKVDDMFPIYPYETKRDIRQHTKEQIVDWVAKHARSFFGPSTSRAISACIRNQHTDMVDVERFAELISFLFDVPVQAGIKIIVWHGYKETTRIPVYSLIMKPHNIFVRENKTKIDPEDVSSSHGL